MGDRVSEIVTSAVRTLRLGFLPALRVMVKAGLRAARSRRRSNCSVRPLQGPANRSAIEYDVECGTNSSGLKRGRLAAIGGGWVELIGLPDRNCYWNAGLVGVAEERS